MTQPSQAPRNRIESVDVVRGIIMIIMALDHTRDFFGAAAVSPTDLATTTVPLFFTRWITHFCAPVFFLLTGTGAYLARGRRTTSGLSRYLLTRGLWLVFLELVVMRAILQFNVDYHVTIITVLWALGWSMIVLSLLVHFPVRVSAMFGAVLVLGHNMFDTVAPKAFGVGAPLWNVLHQPGLLFVSPGHFVILAYPLIPWIGVMALGYALGPVFSWDAERRRQLLVRGGIASLGAFLVLRVINKYGDPVPWAVQRSGAFTLVSFLNVNKYPPSLLFLLLTLGVALLMLRLVDGRTPKVLRPAWIIGTVPMFYYIVHFLIIHLLATVVSYARFGQVHWMSESPTPDKFPFAQPANWAAPLPWVYVAWLTVVLLMYPLCRWRAALKRKGNDGWLSYV